MYMWSIILKIKPLPGDVVDNGAVGFDERVVNTAQLVVNQRHTRHFRHAPKH